MIIKKNANDTYTIKENNVSINIRVSCGGSDICELCGLKTKLTFLGHFEFKNPDILDVVFMRRCQNLKCRHGCEYAGHVWRKEHPMRFWRHERICIRCGKLGLYKK